MDIKNVFKISPLGFLNGPKRSADSGLKLDSTTDRDGNGQSPYQRPPKYRRLTHEELEYAVKKLQDMAPVKEHKWQIHLIKGEGDETQPEIHVLDNLGKLLKKIESPEILSLLESPAPHKGQILKKSA